MRTKYVIKEPAVLDSKYLDYMEQARAPNYNFLPSLVSVRTNVNFRIFKKRRRQKPKLGLSRASSFPLPEQLQRESEAAKTPSASASVISGSSSAIVRDAATAEKTNPNGGVVKFEEKDEEEDEVRGEESKR